jgi:hypothetical protein
MEENRKAAEGVTTPYFKNSLPVFKVYLQVQLLCISNQVNHSRYRPEVTRCFQEGKVPRLRDNDPE